MDKISYVVAENEHYILQINDQNIINNIEYYILLENDAKLEMQIVLYQIQLAELTIHVHLKGDRSHAKVIGLYALDGNQVVKINTYQYHVGQYSTSKLVMKGMLKDKARSDYQGLIKIAQGAHGADALQENKNIVLSKDAKVVSVPSIEVLQHDVQCCHGSAIGKFDQEQLWYLQSKGLNVEQSYKLLTRSFFQSVLDDNDPEIMERICQKMI